jgi:NitT/TauT family transport system substrate-binding protein
MLDAKRPRATFDYLFTDQGVVMRKKPLPTMLAFLLIIPAIFGYTNCRGPSPPPGKTHVVLSQAAKTLLYLPLYVAKDQGFFDAENIDVEITTAGGDSPAFAALASNQAQFAQGDPAFVAISHERGGPGIVIASVLDRVAFWGVAFDKNLQPFTDPRRFKGLSVVTFPEPNTAYVVQKNLLMKGGLKLGVDSKIVQATFGSELGPLQAGQAQISVSIEPTVSQAVSQGGHVVFSYPDGWGPFLLTGLMTTEDFAAKNPTVVQGIVNSYERALRLIREKPDLAKSIGKKYFPEVPEGVISSAVTRMTDQKVFPEHAMVDLQSWKSALQLRVEVGDLKSAEHDALVNNTYGSNALQLQK